jgi:hypothetical protein
LFESTRGANRSSTVGLQAGSELSERAPAIEEYLERTSMSPPPERERKGMADFAEI